MGLKKSINILHSRICFSGLCALFLKVLKELDYEKQKGNSEGKI